MERVLTTERLILRPLEYSDHDAMVETIMSEKDVMYWLPYSDAVATPKGQREVAAGYLNSFIEPWDMHGFGVWAVCSADEGLAPPGAFLGYCGFLPEQLEGAGPEIAYALGKAAWGKGVATEAARACLDWLFTETPEIRAHAVTDTGNRASRNVMEKIGMNHEKDVDLYDSVKKGNGLLPYYAICREGHLEG